jgi:hypothetical protein
MTFKLVSLALIPALLGSTAVYAADLDAQPAPDDTHAFFSLTANGGVAALKMPDGSNGVLFQGSGSVSDPASPILLGGTVGLGFSAGVGQVGDWDTFIGANIFGTYAQGDSTFNQKFSGVGMVAIPGVSTPSNGSINLSTSRIPGGDAHATIHVIDHDPLGGGGDVTVDQDSPNLATAASSSNVASAAHSFIFTAANTIGGANASSLAVGAIADSSGSLFLAVGNLDGLAIQSSISQKVLYAGGDLTFGAARAFDSTTSVQAYAGPSYRFLGTSTDMNTSLVADLPEVSGTTVVHPLYSVARDSEVGSHYFGGVIGASVSHQVTDAISVTLGGEASLYYMHSTLSGRESVSIAGGSGIGDGVNPPVIGPITPQTVNYNGRTASGDDIAYAVRGQSAVTMSVTPNIDVSLAGTVDYLSKVARTNGGADVVYTQTPTSANASWASGAKSLLSFGDMWAFTGTASLTGHF